MHSAEMAARHGAISADHLEWLGQDGIDAMAASGTVAVLLPGAFYTLRETKYPPVQALRDARGLDLQTAIRALAAPLPRPSLRLVIADGVKVDDPAVAESLLRIVQECLTNAARHANADTLTVSLKNEDAGMHLHIEDAGRLKGRIHEGNGLSGIRERVAALGGEMQLGSSASGGLRLDVRLPA